LGEQLVIRSSMPVGQVHDRLTAEVDPEGTFLGAFWDRATERNSDFVGQIGPTSFSIRRRRRLLGPNASANPRARGSLASLPDGGTLITASFPRDIWQRILAAPFVALAVPVVWSEPDLVFRFVELILLILIVLAVVSVGGLGKRQIRELLEEVATPIESWRPYARRTE
jgi:hypothetical protein